MKLNDLLKITKTSGFIELSTKLGNVNFYHDPNAINKLIDMNFGKCEVESFELYPRYCYGVYGGQNYLSSNGYVVTNTTGSTLSDTTTSNCAGSAKNSSTSSIISGDINCLSGAVSG